MEDKDFIYCVFVIIVLFFGMIYTGLSCKQTILEQQIQIEKITIERDLYKNLVGIDNGNDSSSSDKN